VPDSPDGQSEHEAVVGMERRVDTSQKDQEQLAALNNNAESTPDEKTEVESEAEGISHQEEVPDETEHVNRKQEREKGSGDVEDRPSGGDGDERVETEALNTEESGNKDPVVEPASQVHRVESPTVGSNEVPDIETIFKPAEIAAQYHDAENERFDEHGNRMMEEEKIDFTDYDVRVAASSGHTELLKRYLRLMPQYATDRDQNGWQLIHESAMEGRVETMEMLLNDYNVDVNVRAGLVNDGPTPLYLAYRNGFDESSDAVRFIKSRGGINVAPGENAPYKTAAEHTPEELERYNLKDFLIAVIRGNDIQVAQYIVARRDLMDGADENGFRGIHEAVRYGHLNTIQLLINAGTDVNARTGKHGRGWSPLGLAVERYDEDSPVIRMLLRHGAEVYLPDD